MKKTILLIIIFGILFNQIFTDPSFNFERIFFVSKGKNEITSITSSDKDIYLFMKKDSNEYVELHKDKNNSELFIFDLKEPGIYKFKYKKGEIEKELNEKINVYESFDKFIQLTNVKNTTCYYLKDILIFNIESANLEYNTSDLSNINIYLYQPGNEITNSNKLLIKFIKSSNQYSLDLNNKNIVPGNYKLLISEGEFIGDYLDQSIELFITDIVPNSYFYINSKKLYLNTLCQIKNNEFKFVNENIETTILCDSNSIYDEKTKRYLCSFSSNVEDGEYKIYYNSNELNGIIKGLKKISDYEFNLNKFEETKLKVNNLNLYSDFENKNVEKIIIYKNGDEKIEYLSSLKKNDSLKLLYEDNVLKFKLFINKNDEFIFSKVIRKLEDYEKVNPPSENELSYTFNNIKIRAPNFDIFTFIPNYAFVFPDFPYYYSFYFSEYQYNYLDRTIFPYKYEEYGDIKIIFDENNKMDIEYYEKYFCSNYNEYDYNTNRKFIYCKLNNQNNINDYDNDYNNEDNNDEKEKNNTIEAFYFSSYPGYSIFEHEDYSEKILFTPIITHFSNLCQSLNENTSHPEKVTFIFTVPKDEKVKLEYEGIFLNETKIITDDDLITQIFSISNPIENTDIKVYPNENEYKTFKIEFSKNYFPEFIEKEIILKENEYEFEVHFNSSTNDFKEYILQGTFEDCNYLEDSNSLLCYYSTNDNKLTFKDKCGNIKNFDLKINKIKSDYYEYIYDDISISFNGKYFLYPNENYKPCYIDIMYGAKIKNIYINDTLFFKGPLTNERQRIYYDYKEIGELEFQFESIDDFEENQNNRKNCIDCELKYFYRNIIYVYSSITDYFSIFEFSKICLFNLDEFNLTVLGIPEQYFNDLYLEFPSYSNLNDFSETQILKLNFDSYNYNEKNDMYSIFHIYVRDKNYNDNNYYDNNILYSKEIILTNIQINSVTYINNGIVQFKRIVCDIGNINIKDKDQLNIISTQCNYDKDNAVINCNVPENTIGKYYVCNGNRDIKSTYISKTFDIGKIEFDLIELKFGTNAITLTSDDLILKIIDKIIIFDNNGNHKQIIKYNDDYYDDNSNSYTFSFITFPDSSFYTIQIFGNESFIPKEKNLTVLTKDISFNPNDNFFFLGNELQYLKITANGNDKEIVGGIYIKKNDEDFSLNNIFSYEGNNEYKILLIEKGDYSIGFSIKGDDNNNIYKINNLKIKVASNIFDILNFIPPNPFILKESAKKELKLDIIFYFGYNFEITLNLYKEKDEKNKLTFNHFTGTSLYELTDEEINNLENDKTYYFIITQTQTSIGNILYKQKIIFSNIKIEPFYFLNDYIFISNIYKKIDYLTIMNEGNEEYTLDNQKLFKDKSLLYIYIPKNISEKYGNYKMSVNGAQFASFFFSKSILDANFSVSNMTHNNLVTISSINYYMSNVEKIEIISSNNNLKEYDSNKFEIIDNILILTLDVNEGETYTIKKITEKCNFSNEEKCSQLLFLPIGINDNIEFDVFPFYPIKIDDNNNEKEIEIIISIKFNNIFNYLSNYIFLNDRIMKNCEVKNDRVECNYKTEKQSNKYSINYNGNIQNSQNIYILTYKFHLKNQCQFLSNKKNIPILINIDNSVEVYFDDKKLQKINNNDDYNYEISSNDLKIGESYIYLKESNKEKQKITDMKIEIYEEYEIGSIDDSKLFEGKISELIISITNKISSVSNNFALISNYNSEIYSYECTLSGENKIVTCKFDLSSFLSGNYDLSYLNQCGDYIKLQNKIIIYESLSLIDIQPSSVYLEKIDYYTNIKLIFSSNFENDNKPIKIEFIQDSYQMIFEEFRIDSNYVIILNLTPEKYFDMQLGEYKINVVLKNRTILSNNKNIKILSFPSLIESNLTIVKTSKQIKKIPIIFEDSVIENPISRILFQDKTNLEFQTHPSDPKIISIKTTSINLSEGEYQFYVYSNLNMMIYQINIIDSEEIIPNHNFITHNKYGEAYLILSIPESISNVYYKNNIMTTEKELNPFWIGSNIYIYKTKELDEIVEILYKNIDSDEIKIYEYKFYIISNILQLLNLEIPSCIPSYCGNDFILTGNPSNKKYCFDQYPIIIRNYDEDIFESFLTIEILSPSGREIYYYYDTYEDLLILDIDEEEEEEIKGIGQFIIKRNDDNKILYSQGIHFTSFEYTNYSQYTGQVIENNLWFKFKAQCFPDKMKIYDVESDKYEISVSFNCVLENENEYKCDLGQKKIEEIGIIFGYFYSYYFDLNINFYEQINKPYISDLIFETNDYYYTYFYLNYNLKEESNVKKIILKNYDNNQIEIDENFNLENKNYIEIIKIESFIEKIKINLFDDIFLEKFYISKVIFSDGSFIVYEDGKLMINNENKLSIKFEDGSIKKNCFFTKLFIIQKEKFIIEEDYDNRDHYYMYFRNKYKNIGFNCQKDENNILNCEGELYSIESPLLLINSKVSYNLIKVEIIQTSFYSNDNGFFKLILISEGNILNDNIEIKLNDNNSFVLNLNKKINEKKGKYYSIEYSIPFNEIISEKSYILINGERFEDIEIKKISLIANMINIYGSLINTNSKSYNYYEFEKEIHYSNIILKNSEEKIFPICHKLKFNNKIIYCEYSQELKEGSFDIYYLNMDGTLIKFDQSLTISTLNFNYIPINYDLIDINKNNKIKLQIQYVSSINKVFILKLNSFEKKELFFIKNTEEEIEITLPNNINTAIYDIILQDLHDIDIVTFSRLRIYNLNEKVVPIFSLKNYYIQSDVELISINNYELNNIFDIQICGFSIPFSIKNEKIVINQNYFSKCDYVYQIYIYDKILNPIIYISEPRYYNNLFIIDDSSFHFIIHNSYIKNNFKEIKTDSGFYFKIEDNEDQYISYLVLDKTKPIPDMQSLIKEEKIHFILWNDKEYIFNPSHYYYEDENNEEISNNIILVKKEFLEIISRGDNAYLYDNYLLINQDNLFFNSFSINFYSLTYGISSINYYNKINIGEKTRNITVFSLFISDFIEDNFLLTFKEEESNIIFKYNVIIKTGECDPNSFPDIINGEFTCNKCENFNQDNALYYYDDYCKKKCQSYETNCNEECCIKDCLDDNFFLNINDNKCYEKCPDNSGLTYEHSYICYNCVELGKVKIGNLCKKCNENECVEEIYDEKNIEEEKIEEENIEEDSSKLCENYLCYNNGICRVIDNNPKCICRNNYDGIHCENEIISNEETIMNSLIDSLFNLGKDNEIQDIDLSNSNNYQLVEELTKYFRNPTLVANIEKETQKKIIHTVDTIIMKVIDGKTTAKGSHVMKLIDLSLNLNLSILKNKGILRLRLLEENSEEEEVKKIKELLNNGIEIYKKMIFEDINSNNYDKDKSTYDRTESNIMIFQSYTGKENSKKEYKQKSINNKLAYVDYTECISNPENKIFIVLNIPIEIANVNLGDVSSYSVIIKAYDITKETNEDISKCENIKINFPLPNDINLTNYNYYKEYNIDIYNPEDDAFKKICYTNSKLKKDYTFNHRKIIIYSQKQFKGLNNVCIYEEIDSENQMVVMKCKYSENGFGYKYIDNILLGENNKLVPLKCFSLLFKKFNLGILIFVLLLFSIIVGLILFLFYCKDEKGEIKKNKDIENQKSFEEVNDKNNEIKEEHSDKEKDFNFETCKTNQDLKEENNINKNNTFFLIFKKTFLKLHPILSIYNRKPIIMSYLYFVFIIINYFGFNIIFYTDSLIEKKINDKNNDLNRQTLKIFLSILFSILFNLLIKVITWIIFKNYLYRKRRIILSGILIMIITLLFLFYSSIFCDLYPNTQKNWIVSAIICIFIDWIVLSLIFILILSLLDYNGIKLPEDIKEIFLL